MGSLDSRSQRLLSLRAGLHSSPRSAGAVARILHISAGREQLLERMSLLALQTAGDGGCGGSPASTAPVPGTPQLTSTAPWVSARGAMPVATAGSPNAASTSSPASGPASQQHVRATGGRSVAPVVITPATRTVEQASTGQDGVSWPELVLLAFLVLAVSLVLMPGVRRRMLPALAGLPRAEGHVGDAGIPVASLSAAAVLPHAAPVAAPEPQWLREQPAAGSAQTPEPQATPKLAPQHLPEPRVDNHQAVVQPQARSAATWVREHATQGALVATVLAGGLVRILKRGRRR